MFSRFVSESERPVSITLLLWLGLACWLGFLLVDAVSPLPMDKLVPDASVDVLDKDGAVLRSFLNENDAWHFPVQLGDVSEDLARTLVGYEDRFYRWHSGLNPVSVLSASVANFRAREVVRGGSTITMQVARLMEPKPRTLRNKLWEAFRSAQLEWHFTKDEILEFYFNLAPYGGNLVGVKAATRTYLGKEPDQISLGEAALLVALPRSPTRYRPDRFPDLTAQARDLVLARRHVARQFEADRIEAAKLEQVPDARYPAPFKTPHLAEYLVGQHPEKPTIQTGIDASLNESARRLLSDHVNALRSQGITNASAVIIDNESMEVRAFVGSADYGSTVDQGQVNGVLSRRSPGSALKPFVYALAMDRGLIAPHSLINDLPVDYGGYAPVNYDETYRGSVSARSALIQSLNVPAVNLESRLTGDGLGPLMRKASVRSLTEDDSHYGLSIVLGGASITLLELAGLYAGLSNGGLFTSPKLDRHGGLDSGARLLSSEASFMTVDILSDLRRPDLPAVWEWTVDMPRVAWKTGTSYGHRDAWTVGVTPTHTIGVWVGNFDGTGAPALVGADVAAPLALSLFRALPNSREVESWYDRPEGLRTREVCEVSGMPRTAYCAGSISEPFIPGKSPNRSCSIHQPIMVDRETRHRLCSQCKHGRSHESRVIEVWPREVAAWRARNSFPMETAPPHLTSCPQVATGLPPLIESPADGSTFIVRERVAAKYQRILLQASATNLTGNLFWFLNDSLIHQSGPAARLFIDPTLGKHELTCLDDEGRSSTVSFEVLPANNAAR